MQVQDILTAMSTDMRQVISPTGINGTLFITWVDRIQKNALHTSPVYNWLLRQQSTFSVVSGTSAYTVTTTYQPRRLLLVYDRTFDRLLVPVENLGLPASKTEDTQAQPLSIPKPMLSAATSEQWPEYYTRINASSTDSVQLVLFPAPQKTAFNGTYEVYYEMVVPDLENLTDVLVLPDDALDLMTAGVNQLAAMFLKLDQESQYWGQQYEMLKRGVSSEV